MTTISRYASFSDDPRGGNPAGVVLDAAALTDDEMQAIAAEVGYSETAFIVSGPALTPHFFYGDKGDKSGAERRTYRVRYFSPLAEVPFCGHATVATAVALGPGEHVFETSAGRVPVTVDDRGRATLTSVEPAVGPLNDLDALLTALRWDKSDLDGSLPPKVAYAGAYHPIVATTSRKRLADLDYDVPALTALMRERDWTTIQLVHRTGERSFDVRNPFPVGGVYEDPATGAAAAAFGAYLRELGIVPGDATVELAQGADLGRPSRITVTLVPGESGVRVSGTAVPITG